jgi:hypothetical protein
VNYIEDYCIIGISGRKLCIYAYNCILEYTPNFYHYFSFGLGRDKKKGYRRRFLATSNEGFCMCPEMPIISFQYSKHFQNTAAKSALP